MTLRDAIDNDNQAIFFNLNEFAEEVVYQFVNPIKSAATVNAVIERNPPEVLGPKGEVFQPKFIVSLSGVDAVDINTGGDKIHLKTHENDSSTKAYSVLIIMAQSHNFVRLAIG